jgi:ABC-type iron transport system FetAB permease component
MNHRICSSLLSVILICGIVCKNISAFSGASLPRQRNFNNGRIRNNNHSSRYGGDSLEYYDDDDENSSTLFKRLFKRKLSHLRQRYKSSSPTIIRRLFRKGKRIYILLFPIFVICTGSAAAHATASSTMILPDSLLGPRNILTATVMLFSLGAIPLSLFGVGNIAKVLLYSAGRCAIQVSLLGSIVLHRMMGVKNPGYVAMWILGVGLLASREAIGRIQYKYPHMERNMYLSVVTGGFIILSLTVGLKLFGDIQPWFNPRTWIPIAGMLFGNTLNASALGASSITKQFAVDSDSVELRLIRGADTREAISPLVEESYRIALMPTINSLAATGIIHVSYIFASNVFLYYIILIYNDANHSLVSSFVYFFPLDSWDDVGSNSSWSVSATSSCISNPDQFFDCHKCFVDCTTYYQFFYSSTC